MASMSKVEGSRFFQEILLAMVHCMCLVGSILMVVKWPICSRLEIQVTKLNFYASHK
ncbi:hypothetical protein ACSBR2_005476 [Camellia fascicularis]